MSLQEENKILDKMHRNKVSEVEKLSSTVRDLEEAVLAGGAAVNAARDYQRQVHDLMVRDDCYENCSLFVVIFDRLSVEEMYLQTSPDVLQPSNLFNQN